MRSFYTIEQIKIWARSVDLVGPCSVLKVCESNFRLEYMVSPKHNMHVTFLGYHSQDTRGGMKKNS